MPDFQELYNAVLNGEHKKAIAVTEQAIAEGVPPLELITRYMVPAMDEVGKRFENEILRARDLVAARAMKGSLDVARPLLAAPVSTRGGWSSAR